MNRATKYLAVSLAGLLLIAPSTAEARSLGQTRIGAGKRKDGRRVAATKRAARRRATAKRRAKAARTASTRRARRGLVRLRDGEGYKRMRPHRAWGTRYAVKHLHQVLAAHHAEYPEGPQLVVGDLSRRGGGRLRPHRSHRTGRDVDIWVPRKSERGRLDLPRTWALINTFAESGAVEMIFLDYRLQRALYRYAKREQGLDDAALAKIFEYPNRRRPKGPITSLLVHSRGHYSHMHVRFHHRRLTPPPTT